jgi:HEAT repeat protein
MLFWVIFLGGAFVLVMGGAAVASLVREDDDVDVQARLSRLEERLSNLDARNARPIFLVDPSQPSDRIAVSEAVAALSKELADLRMRLDGDRGRSPHELAASDDPGTRRRSIRQLRDLARTDPEARRLLSKLLGDPDPRVRREVVDALAELRDPAALGEIASLLGDRDPRLRGHVAKRVGDLAVRSKEPGERAKAVQMLDPLLADENTRVRREAVDSLRKVGGPEVVSALTRALGDKSFEVQELAIEGLERAGDRQAIAALRQTYGDGAGPNALEAAVALNRLGDPSAFQKEAERLRMVLQQPGASDERREALQLLVEHNPQEARALIDRALRDPSEAMRREAQRLAERLRH